MNALQLLQQKAGVTPDGKFGPMTFKAAASVLHLTDVRAVHFFAQCAHETGMFAKFEENLNYSAGALVAVFGKYFTVEEAEEYARQPERIANRVYADRMGNGGTTSGEGWKYRGRGALQLTGKNNYRDFASSIQSLTLLDNPDAVATDYAFESARWFFDKNGLWTICDQGTDDNVVKALTRRINGGYNGLEHRVQLTKKYAGYIG